LHSIHLSANSAEQAGTTLPENSGHDS
jgi:hypothetical protein